MASDQISFQPQKVKDKKMHCGTILDLLFILITKSRGTTMDIPFKCSLSHCPEKRKRNTHTHKKKQLGKCKAQKMFSTTSLNHPEWAKHE